MKERPILMNGPMVRATLDGSKTQTRRLVKPQPDHFHRDIIGKQEPYDQADWDRLIPQFGEKEISCPYGQPGNWLWVRETWGVISNSWDESGELCDWLPNRPATAIHEMRFGRGYYDGHVIYAADGPNEWAGDDDGGGEPRSAWHPSIHMPRIASRITLEILSVRVERLNDISEADALAEGALTWAQEQETQIKDTSDARQAFMALWGSINGPGSWDSNPWLWAVEFKRVTP